MNSSGRSEPSDSSHISRTSALVTLGLTLLTFLTFLPVLHCGFIDFDDPEYISQNVRVLGGLTGENVRWAMTTIHMGYRQPLSWLSLMLDSTLFDATAETFHRTNLAIHALSAGVVFLVLSRMTGTLWRAALVAALYAVHPLRVESVAWAAERKDVLSNLLAWISIGAYVAYARRPGVARYLLVVVPFILAIAAKPMAVTLPCLFLLLDYWPLGRSGFCNTKKSSFRRNISPSPGTPGEGWGEGLWLTTWRRKDPHPNALPEYQERGQEGGFTRGPIALLIEKLPLFALAIGAGVAALFDQHRYEATLSFANYSLFPRLVTMADGYVAYIWKMVWFGRLSVFYPLPAETRALPAAAAALFLIAVTVWTITQRGKRPWLIVGWLWFLGMLLPMSGIFQSGSQSMADRFSYLPCVGLLIMLVWSMPAIQLRWAIPAAATAIGCLVAATWVQCGYWRDTQTLFSRALEVTDANWLAHDQIALCLYRQGDQAAAEVHWHAAARINAFDPTAQYNLGLADSNAGRDDQAIARFSQAISVRPNQWQTRTTLADCLARRGDLQRAAAEYRRALELNPEYGPAHDNYGRLLARMGLLDAAAGELRLACRIDPEDREAIAELEKINDEIRARAKNVVDVR